MLSNEEIDACAELAEELAGLAIGLQRGRLVGRDERSTKTGPGDFVTVVDLETERQTRDRLAEAFPDHVVHGEEFGTSGDPDSAAPAWYLDPLDGTSNFVHGLPWSSFSLAVADELGLAVGVVADPHRGEVFAARRGGGAQLNGQPIACRDAESLQGGLVLTELVGTHPWRGLASLLDVLGERDSVTRVPGSTALSLASLAAGRATAVVLGGFHPIDIAAGMLLAREAGAALIAPQCAEPVVHGWVANDRNGPSGAATIGGPAGGGPGLGLDLLVAVVPAVRAELVELLCSLGPER